MARGSLILGMGESGCATAQWLAFLKEPFYCADSRSVVNTAFDTVTDVDLRRPETFIDADIICRIICSPGLSPDELQEVVAFAKRHQIAIESELDLFFEALDALEKERDYHPQCVAVTGTNGKTTTVSWCSDLLRFAGIGAVVAGNISPSLLAMLLAKLKDNSLPEVWVLELSSFQLYWSNAVRLRRITAAVVLNLSEDHLDWHGTMAAYRSAKAKILAAQSVLCYQGDWVFEKLGKEPKAVVCSLAPTPQAEWFCHHGELYNKNTKQALCKLSELAFKGRHHYLNMMAALGLALCCCDRDAEMIAGLKLLKPLAEHRLSEVAQHNDIRFIDDSKATNVGATIAALEAFAEQPEVTRCLLILGGDDKGQDLLPLKQVGDLKVTHVAIIGAQPKALYELFKTLEVTVFLSLTIKQALADLYAIARPQDVVLLSPACASFDQFANYKERGKHFAECIREGLGNHLQGEER